MQQKTLIRVMKKMTDLDNKLQYKVNKLDLMFFRKVDNIFNLIIKQNNKHSLKIFNAEKYLQTNYLIKMSKLKYPDFKKKKEEYSNKIMLPI